MTENQNDCVESQCLDSFGYEAFDQDKCVPGFLHGCPVRGCTAQLQLIPHRKSKVPFCGVHGLRLHANTFVYFNGDASAHDGRLRNFVIQRDAVREVALGRNNKVESHRLGYEMSEDALSWNVFVGLAEAGKLRKALEYLTGRTVHGEPRLYLWGQLVDLAHGFREAYAPLTEVRRMLESDIHKFKTEPDIMVVVERELIVCVEAKFGSGNPIAHDTDAKLGEKPSRPDELIRRYYEKASAQTKRTIVVDRITSTFHSQLFRNVVFASEMAAETSWHVVNLVSSSQLAADAKSSTYSFADPTNDVRAYLNADSQGRFSYRTWEALYKEVIEPDPKLSTVREYMRSKSAHFRRAFQNI